MALEKYPVVGLRDAEVLYRKQLESNLKKTYKMLALRTIVQRGREDWKRLKKKDSAFYIDRIEKKKKTVEQFELERLLFNYIEEVEATDEKAKSYNDTLSKITKNIFGTGFLFGANNNRGVLRKLLKIARKRLKFLQSDDYKIILEELEREDAVITDPFVLDFLENESFQIVNGLNGLHPTTKKSLKVIIANAIITDKSMPEIMREINDKIDEKSRQRAITIVRTELARATGVATLRSAQASGIKHVQWITRKTAEDPPCVDTHMEIREAGQVFSNGKYHEPVHPRCYCRIVIMLPENKEFYDNIKTNGFYSP